jgi:hypothetical protein
MTNDIDQNNEKTRLRVKLGAAEIEYDGGTQFLKDEVMPTVSKILNLVQDQAELQRPLPVITHMEGVPILPPTATFQADYSTNTIATLIAAKTGGDLAIAAAAYLILVKNKEFVSRAELLEEMQNAKSFYKTTMNNNLTTTLKRLAKDDRLRQVGNNTYSLSQQERQTLEQKLAQSR